MAIYSGFTHWKWWLSIAMLVYQRVDQSSLYSEFQIVEHQSATPSLDDFMTSKNISYDSVCCLRKANKRGVFCAEV